VTRGLPLQRCDACSLAVFPPRLACPICGGRRWREEHTDGGVAEQVTVVRHALGHDGGDPHGLASVLTDAGPLVIAGTDPGLSPGSRVELWRDGNVLRAERPGFQPVERGG
jgi:hypothetical protein